MSNDLTETEIRKIVDDIGLEQILWDAQMSQEYILGILHDAGYIDLSIYLEQIYPE